MLTRITDSAWLTERTGELLKAGLVTNAMPDSERLKREISAGTLYASDYPEGLLLLFRRSGYDLLTWLLRRDAPVPAFVPERDTVMEQPYRGGDRKAAALGAEWERAGFLPLLSRVRLTRKAEPTVFDVPDVRTAEAADCDRLYRLLTDSFPAKTGCLPTITELTAAIEKEQVLCTDEGILHLEQNGRISEIRHLAVRGDCAGRGIATRLVRAFISRYGGSLCRVWTGEMNEAALHIYREAGFREDGWRSDIREFRKEI